MLARSLSIRFRVIRRVALAVILSLAVLALPGGGGPAEAGSPQPFTAAISSDVLSLDPALTTDGASFQVSSQIFETLTRYKRGATTVEPGLAESWSVSPGGLTWTFNLRPGVKFHDGTDLNAAAVEFNYLRWWDPANPYHVGSFTYFASLFGGFKGDANCLIAGVGAIGTTQFQITLTEKFSPLPSFLALPALAIASPAAIVAGNLGTAPVGSGPFLFVERVVGDHITLAANPSYWGQMPAISPLTFRGMAGAGVRLAALQSNTVQSADNLPLDSFPLLAADPGVRPLARTELVVGYLGINRGHTPLGNLLIRQAIAHAIDKSGLIADHYAPLTLSARQLLPPTLWGSDAALTGYSYDPALARSLLAQAGYPAGFTTSLALRDVVRSYLPNPVATANAISADLEAVGIHAPVQIYQSTDFLNRVYGGQLDLYLLGWGADYPHPDNFLNAIVCNGTLAFGPRDDILCDQLQAALADFSFSSELSTYQWASRRVYDTLPLVPLVHVQSLLGTRRNVLGLLPSPIAVEAYQSVDFASNWLYLPTTLK